MDITVVGSGYVGLVAGACFADSGNDVLCVDVNEEKIRALKNGEIPIYEPGLEDLVQQNTKSGRLKFTTSLKEGVEFGSIIFIAVGTPQDEDGAADLTHVVAVAKGIGQYMNGPKIVVDKSTVPVGTAKLVLETISGISKHKVEVVSNPEFLKEGAAIEDFMKPDRVVVGVASEHAAEMMKELYAPFVRNNHPILVMDIVSAEMTKYAANSMLATRVSFMNEIANLCEKVGADINSVRVGIGTDSRIGMSFLFPGIGYGGSCFPKDVQALIKAGRDYGMELKIPIAVEEVNREQKTTLVQKIIRHYGRAGVKGKTFAVWGLAFKPQTDDVREAPAAKLCEELLKLGASIQAHNPEALETFKSGFSFQERMAYFENNYTALENADALIICTEWKAFRSPNFSRIKQLMREPLIFDGRNVYEPKEMDKEGFCYYSVGRAQVGSDRISSGGGK